MIGRTIHDRGIISMFARHPNAANLLMVLMVIFGVFALGKINTQFFPTVEREAVSITVTWTGASPEDVEKNILELIGKGIRHLYSSPSVRTRIILRRVESHESSEIASRLGTFP